MNKIRKLVDVKLNMTLNSRFVGNCLFNMDALIKVGSIDNVGY